MLSRILILSYIFYSTNLLFSAYRCEVALRAHLSSHDDKMYPRRYRSKEKARMRHCKSCNFNTNTHQKMKTHFKNVHGGTRPETFFEYMCHICDKEFKKATSLENHLLIHNEVRDYHCTQCKATFTKPH